MNIHEYQAKQILKSFNVPILKGGLAFTVGEAMTVAAKIGGLNWVVKAQIHAGGRGLGGGVKVAKGIDELRTICQEMLGMTLITKQTGYKGKSVHKIYIEELAQKQNEYYLSIVFDRTKECHMIIASAKGGMDIEELAHLHSSEIIKITINPLLGIRDYHIRELAFKLELVKEDIPLFLELVRKLFRAYESKDFEMLEINPLVRIDTIDKKGFYVLDAKVSIDDLALYRQVDLLELRDFSEEVGIEVEAKSFGLNYVDLEGDIGCMVNGAGLAMATMDTIKHEGGRPANFLDVGGGANINTISKGFEIILHDASVKSILVNIFGGIVRCDRIALGILKALEHLKVKVPVVIRLAGTNASEALEILDQSHKKQLFIVQDLSEAAKLAVKKAKSS